MPATRSPLALAMLSLLAHSSALSIDALYSLADTHASSHDHDHDLHFYGKIQTQCEFDDCFSAVVASGRTNFEGDGGDLANIYVPANDYDTWKQFIVPGDKVPVEGEFIYQMQNETLSCLTIELRWGFARDSDSAEPYYQCVATPLAMNWDCHLDWGLVTECSYNSTTNQISALYTVTNMGPERVEGEGKVIIVNKHGEEKNRVRVLKSSGVN